MEHRNLNHQDLTLAAIDNILERGELPDWLPLLQAIKKDPHGDVAEKTLRICSSHEVYGSSAVFLKFVETQRTLCTEPTIRKAVVKLPT